MGKDRHSTSNVAIVQEHLDAYAILADIADKLKDHKISGDFITLDTKEGKITDVKLLDPIATTLGETRTASYADLYISDLIALIKQVTEDINNTDDKHKELNKLGISGPLIKIIVDKISDIGEENDSANIPVNETSLQDLIASQKKYNNEEAVISSAQQTNAPEPTPEQPASQPRATTESLSDTTPTTAASSEALENHLRSSRADVNLESPLYAGISEYKERHSELISAFKVDPANTALLDKYQKSPTPIDENDPQFFRKLFARLADDPAEQDKNKYTGSPELKKSRPEKASVKMEALFGKEGTKLYQLALQEEANSVEYRDAVLEKSSIKNEGIKKRILGIIAGPSSSGKTRGAKTAVDDEIGRQQSFTGETKDSYKTIITVDGATSREVSQVQQYAKRVAENKGYTGVSNLYSKSKAIKKIKNHIFNHAVANNNSMMIPDTFSSLNPLSIGKHKYLKYFKKEAEKAKEGPENSNTSFLFVRISGKNLLDFKNTIEHWGSNRAWLTESPNSSDLREQSKAEHKAYDKKGFLLGVLFSKLADDWFQKNINEKTVQINNDIVLIKYDLAKKQWVSAKHGDEDIVNISKKILEAYKNANHYYDNSDLRPSFISQSDALDALEKFEKDSQLRSAPTKPTKDEYHGLEDVANLFNEPETQTPPASSVTQPPPSPPPEAATALRHTASNAADEMRRMSEMSEAARKKTPASPSHASPQSSHPTESAATTLPPQRSQSEGSGIKHYSTRVTELNSNAQVENLLKNRSKESYAKCILSSAVRKLLDREKTIPSINEKQVYLTVLNMTSPNKIVASRAVTSQNGQPERQLYYPDNISNVVTNEKQYMKWAITEVENFRQQAKHTGIELTNIYLSENAPDGLKNAVAEYSAHQGLDFKLKDANGNLRDMDRKALSEEQKSSITKIRSDIVNPKQEQAHQRAESAPPTLNRP